MSVYKLIDSTTGEILTYKTMTESEMESSKPVWEPVKSNSDHLFEGACALVRGQVAAQEAIDRCTRPCIDRKDAA